jgi:WD40 repeat protein
MKKDYDHLDGRDGWDIGAKDSMLHDESQFKLLPRITISDNTSEVSIPIINITANCLNLCSMQVFCVRFSPDGNFVATGCGDGAIRVFNSQTGALAYNLQVPR